MERLTYGKVYDVIFGKFGGADSKQALYIGKIRSKRTKNVYRFLIRDCHKRPVVYSTSFDEIPTKDKILHIKKFVNRKLNILEKKFAMEILERNNL